MNAQPPRSSTPKLDISVRPLHEDDLVTADHILRLAFGTFLGLPAPSTFMGDADYVRTRWRANPSAAFAAVAGGKVSGSNFASNWGSVGIFGPLTIHPELWDRGVGKRLMEPIMQCFDHWGTAHAGLFTFANSAKHVALYQRFGFWPRFLTAIMSKSVQPAERKSQWTKFSEVQTNEQPELIESCRDLTDSIYGGLDLGMEMRAVDEQRLGDTVLLWNDGRLAGLAVCHCGPGSEAGGGACYIKFGAVRPSPAADRSFDHLLDACEALAAEKGLSRLIAGTNTARHEAYGKMLQRGFRTELQGVAMQRPNEAGYNRPGVYLIDDWR